MSDSAESRTTTEQDDRELVEMTMHFSQTVTVTMPMYELPPTPEDALDAWWSMGPEEGLEALWGDNKRLWTCTDVSRVEEDNV